MLLTIGRGSIGLLVGFIAGVIAAFCATAVVAILAVFPDMGSWDTREVVYTVTLTIFLGLFGALTIAFGREIGRLLASQQLVFWVGVILAVVPGSLLWLWLAFATND